MNGKAGTTLRIGTSKGMPMRAPATYESAVPKTIVTGATVRFIVGLYSADEADFGRGGARADAAAAGVPLEQRRAARRAGRQRARGDHVPRLRGGAAGFPGDLFGCARRPEERRRQHADAGRRRP